MLYLDYIINVSMAHAKTLVIKETEKEIKTLLKQSIRTNLSRNSTKCSR